MATLSTTTAQLDAYQALSGWQVGSATTTLGGIWQDTATQQQSYQYYMQVPSAWASMASAIQKIKFWRINKVVEMEEGGRFEDPLDELRLKVARWLQPKEKYNLAS